MKNVSIDNGHTFVSANEALVAIPLDVMVEYMDDDTREAVASALAPCSDVEFLEGYLSAAAEDLIIG